MVTEGAASWNVLTDSWVHVATPDGRHRLLSPLDVLAQAAQLRAIEADSPLDVFAAHRFLLTLLYWKADVSGGVEAVRKSLLDGGVPAETLNAIQAESGCFDLFDKDKPFLQDPTLRSAKKEPKSIGSFFTEFATGTNVAHFHHGDDKKMRLCLRCATAGLMRLIPWSQAGGSGLTPSVHNAPPIVVLALGDSVAHTLGLNLVPFPQGARPGRPTWTGIFKPTDQGKPADQWREIPYLEALTWNPRIVHLPTPETGGHCWRCSAGPEELTLGPTVFLKNELTKKPPKAPAGFNFPWHDPAAFYPIGPEDPSPKDRLRAVTTRKSTKESQAFTERDLAFLGDADNPVTCPVREANPGHKAWLLIIPCTDAANNKSYDVRAVRLSELTADALQQARTTLWAARGKQAMNGWRIPVHARRVSWAFLRETHRLSQVDWGILAAAANRTMDQSPEAFDLFSALYWRVRDRSRAMPNRQSLWLVLKLMATTPSAQRTVETGGGFNPLRELPRRQTVKPPNRRTAVLREYPRSLPRGVALETALPESATDCMGRFVRSIERASRPHPTTFTRKDTPCSYRSTCCRVFLPATSIAMTPANRRNASSATSPAGASPVNASSETSGAANPSRRISTGRRFGACTCRSC